MLFYNVPIDIIAYANGFFHCLILVTILFFSPVSTQAKAYF